MASAKQKCPASSSSVWPLLHLWLLCASVGGLASAAGPIVATFSEPTGNGGHRLQHLVVDKHSALVYIGGVNRLYQLSPELERQVTVETGPREDSPECPAVDCLGSVVKRLTDNVNKALVIDYTDTRLIACGTLYQGK
jgi:plexin A